MVEAHIPQDFHVYISEMKDVSKVYYEILIVACCDYLQKNIAVITSNSVWQYNESKDVEMVVFINSITNVLATLPDMYER